MKSASSLLARLIKAERKLKEAQRIIEEIRSELLAEAEKNKSNYSDW